jgi:hypothetical protein
LFLLEVRAVGRIHRSSTGVGKLCCPGYFMNPNPPIVQLEIWPSRDLSGVSPSESLEPKLEERKISTCVFVALLSLTGFFFVPAQIQLTNAREFPITFFDILGPMALLVGISFLVVAGLVFGIRGRLGDRITSGIFGFGFLLYLQANWILWDYGTLDGRDIAWPDLTYRGVVDGLIWIAVITFCVIFGRRFRRLLNWVAVIVIAVQTINLGSLLIKTPGALSQTEKTEAAADLYAFSKEKNVLIVMMDTLQADVLQQVFDEYREDMEVFDGFTFYRNSLGGFPKTRASIALILSGKYYDNKIDIDTFNKSISRSEQTLPRFLKDKGFRSHLIGTQRLFVGNRENSDIYYDYLQHATGLDLRAEVLYLVDLVAFRALPHFAKRKIHNDHKWFLSNILDKEGIANMPQIVNVHDLVFTRDFVRYAYVDEERPVLKYIQYWGVHPPLRLNENLEYVELTDDRGGLVTYQRSGVEIINRLFQKLKEIGVYNNTLIIVTGDHGAGRSGFRADPRAGGVASELIEDTTVESLIKSCALPAMLVKEIGARGMIQYNDSPVTLGDYPASIAGILGYEHSFPGVDFLTAKVDPERERFFNFYRGYEKNAAGDEVAKDFTKFRVSGHSWLDASWERFVAKQPEPDTVYQLGERISFVRGGNFEKFAARGFSLPEVAHTWTDRKIAGVVIRFPEPPGDLLCLINIRRVWGRNQRVEVWANDSDLLADWLYENGSTSEETREIVVPAELTEKGLLVLEFRLPNANLSPRDIGLSAEDGRKLGIGLSWIEFQKP